MRRHASEKCCSPPPRLSLCLSFPAPTSFLCALCKTQVRTQRGVAICKPGRGLSSETDSARTFVLDSLASRTVKIQTSNVKSFSQRRQWQPTPVLLPAKSHGRRSLVGCSPWDCEESDTTERLHFHFSLSCIGEGNGNPLQCSCLENPRDGEPGGLPSMGSHRVGHDLAAAAASHSVLRHGSPD